MNLSYEHVKGNSKKFQTVIVENLCEKKYRRSIVTVMNSFLLYLIVSLSFEHQDELKLVKTKILTMDIFNAH